MVGVCLLFYALPLFRIVPLQASREQSAAQVFDADAFVEEFWNTRLLPAQANAVDAEQLLAALRKEPANAMARFGRRLGLSSTASFFVSGTGTIAAADDRSVSIALGGKGDDHVLIETGPVFGNTIRDGSGLLDVNDFPSSRDFNAISAEINRRVEERVFPKLNQKAAVGVMVRFVGCVDLADAEGEFATLRLIPVVVEFP